MDQAQHNTIAGFIWNIADDVLRDVYVRGKYRDVILPMTVIRRLDAVLEPTKQGRPRHEAAARRGRHRQPGRRRCAGRRSRPSTTSRPSPSATCRPARKQQQLKADFEAYLDGFSPNVQEILDKFKFRNQIPHAGRGRHPRQPDREVPRTTINLSPDPVSWTRTATSACPAWTTTPWARSSRS